MWEVNYGDFIVIESKTCLKPMVEPWASSLLRLHSHYRNSVLPFSGGLYDQPNYYLEAMEIIDSVIIHD